MIHQLLKLHIQYAQVSWQELENTVNTTPKTCEEKKSYSEKMKTEDFSIWNQTGYYLRSPQVLNSMNNGGTRTKTENANCRD